MSSPESISRRLVAVAGGLWKTRSVFQGVWEGAGRGLGGGSLPYPGRPPAGEMGARGKRGSFPQPREFGLRPLSGSLQVTADQALLNGAPAGTVQTLTRLADTALPGVYTASAGMLAGTGVCGSAVRAAIFHTGRPPLAREGTGEEGSFPKTRKLGHCLLRVLRSKPFRANPQLARHSVRCATRHRRRTPGAPTLRRPAYAATSSSSRALRVRMMLLRRA